MAAYSRREFLRGMGAFALLPALPTVPEMVLHGGNILTVDARPPRTQPASVRHHRLATGW